MVLTQSKLERMEHKLVKQQKKYKDSKSKNKQKADSEKKKIAWRPRPKKVEPPTQKPLFHVQFRYSEVVEEITQEREQKFCPHVKDSLNTHIVVFDPVCGKMMNPSCSRCSLIPGRAGSCPPLFLPSFKIQKTFKRLEKVRDCDSMSSCTSDSNRLTLPKLPHRLMRMRSRSAQEVYHEDQFHYAGHILPSIF